MSNNFSPYLLSLLLLVSEVIPLVATAHAPISNVDYGSVDNLITQLERISNAHSQLLTQLQQQITDNQRDIDSLRGQIQENQYQLLRIVERQTQIYQQINSFSIQEPTSSQDSQPQASKPTNNGRQSVAPDLSGLIIGHGDAKSTYNKAVTLVLKKKQYDQAISAFHNFIKLYPDSIYQPNANYWLGQLKYNQGKKDDALYYFALVAKNYPKSPKASDALLKIGVIMQEKGQKDKARVIYQQIGKLYPSNETANLAQKRLAAL